MNSFILRVRKLSLFAGPFFQSGAAVIPFPHRYLFTETPLCSNSVPKKIHYEAHDVQNYAWPSNNGQNFGRIVDLGLDFDDVRDDDVKTAGRKKRTKRPSKQIRVLDQGENTEEIKENENFLEKSNITKMKKPKYGDTEAESLFISVMTGLKSKKLKERKQKVILEGKRLIHDALSMGFTPDMIFYSRKSDVEMLNLPESVKLYKISYKSFRLWSNVVTPQGIIGIFKMPDLTKLHSNTNTIPLTIICDNVREPGNLGTILRVAAAVGCRKIILSKGCVNIWEPKVLRAGAGAHFHFSVYRDMTWSEIESEIGENTRVLLADSNLDPENDITDTEKQEEVNPFMVKSDGYKYLPLHCYSSVEYTNDDTVIVVGGETQGLCSAAYKFAEKRKGVRLFIPLDNGIESLNNSVALGILAYEIKRQLSSTRHSENPVTGKALSMNG